MTMKSGLLTIFLVAMATCCLTPSSFVAVVEASVFLPQTSATRSMSTSTSARSFLADREARHELRWQLRQQERSVTKSSAMAIPGYGVAEQVFVGGFSTFLSIYNLIITARILLSWFPQAQGVAALQPVYAITDPYLNLFRGLIPPLFGLDLSPILAFFLLSVLGNVTAAVGAEIPANQPPPQSVFKSRMEARREAVLNKLFSKKQQPRKGDLVSLNF